MNLDFSLKSFTENYYTFQILKNKVWIVSEWIGDDISFIIFEPNNNLLLIKKGVVEKIKWEAVGKNRIIINRKEGSYIFKIELSEENLIVLKADNDDSFIFLINEPLYLQGIKSNEEVLNYLIQKYPLIEGLSTTSDSYLEISGKKINIEKSKEEAKKIRYKKQDSILLMIIGVLVFILFIIIGNGL
ncbi:hypothetical protein [Pontibacter harenae]|uniref:hypothetical protein n=1 Tax=Pontibacter harenae TaxID=2894083 RepID=UPI001E5B190A|nr:hypothetical protein [Pontibacter harenae]MCC9167055.1 hypothetical protein [Pontibacter harenae]